MAMDETTQQNAALVEEAAAASQAIVEQAQTLNNMIARYNVGASSTPVSTRAEAARRVERRSKERPWSKPAAAVKAGVTPLMGKAVEGADWSEF